MAEIISSNRIYRCREPFKIEYIPEVMKRIGWEKSAYIMNKWFSLEAKEMLEDEKTATKGYTYDKYDKNYVDKTTFTMEWIKSFKRGNDAYDELLSKLSIHKLDGNYSLSKDEEKSLIATSNELKKVSAFYIKNNQPKIDSSRIEDIHKDFHFQTVKLDGYYNVKLDDLYGSLGNFSIHLAVLELEIISKSNIPNTNRDVYKVLITKVGVYMKDTYEFVGRQYLGHWNCSGVGIQPLSAITNTSTIPGYNFKLESSTAIGNDDFNEYRKENKKGGDMLLFSDVEIIDIEIAIDIEV